jgi:hypothetical protein
VLETPLPPEAPEAPEAPSAPALAEDEGDDVSAVERMTVALDVEHPPIASASAAREVQQHHLTQAFLVQAALDPVVELIAPLVTSM